MSENQKSEWVYLAVSTVMWPRDSMMSSSLCCTLPMRPCCEWLRGFLQSNQARWFLIYAGSRPPRPLGSKRWTSHPAYNTVSKNAASFPSRLWRYRQKIPFILEQPETSQWTVQPITVSLHQLWHVEEKSYRIWGNLQFCCCCFLLEIIYNKFHPSSLTKKQGSLNGWHALKWTSLVLNVLAVLKKSKQKTLCYLKHTSRTSTKNI